MNSKTRSSREGLYISLLYTMCAGGKGAGPDCIHYMLYPFFSLQSQLTSRQQEWSFLCRRHMHEVNTRRCRRQPMYGSDLIRAVRTVYPQENVGGVSKRPPPASSPWLWSGYVACSLHQRQPQHWGSSSAALGPLLLSHRQRAVQLEDTIQRCVSSNALLSQKNGCFVIATEHILDEM